MPVTRKEFEDVFPQLVDDLVANCKQSNLPEQALKWYKQVWIDWSYSRQNTNEDSPWSTTQWVVNTTAACP